MISKSKFDLESDLTTYKDIAEYLKDEKFCCELYAAMCNTTWEKIILDPEQRVVYALEDVDLQWYCSFRYAGGIVARLRNELCDLVDDESYMDWYCSANEGVVSDRIRKLFEELRWKQVDY